MTIQVMHRRVQAFKQAFHDQAQKDGSYEAAVEAGLRAADVAKVENAEWNPEFLTIKPGDTLVYKAASLRSIGNAITVHAITYDNNGERWYIVKRESQSELTAFSAAMVEGNYRRMPRVPDDARPSSSE